MKVNTLKTTFSFHFKIRISLNFYFFLYYQVYCSFSKKKKEEIPSGVKSFPLKLWLRNKKKIRSLKS